MLSEYQNKFAMRAIQRKKIYLVISILSVVLALGLSIYYSWLAFTVAGFDKGIHIVLVILILLNARQNFRQYSYAKIMKKLINFE